MKKFILCCMLALLLPLSACSVRNTPSAVPDSTGEEQQTSPAKKPGKKKDKKAVKEEVPASGTDLCIPEPLSEAAQASLDALRAEIRSSGNLCGMAFLGYVSPLMPLEESILTYGVFEELSWADQFPFLYEMTPEQCVNPAFSDLYCLVPGESVTKIRIVEMEMDEFAEPTETESSELAVCDGTQPLLFSAESNGWGGSNLRVILTDSQGREAAFCPAILANLGTIAPCDGVLDFTPPKSDPAG